MSQRSCISALITPNIFQNSLSRNPETSGYCTEWLRRLASLSVRWYMLQSDFDQAFTFWRMYQLGGSAECQAIYQVMESRIHTLPITEDLLEFAGQFKLNFNDALRLACAFETPLDLIVTWEAYQFAESTRGRQTVEQYGYFNRSTESILADENEPILSSIAIYGLSSFMREMMQPEVSQVPPMFHLHQLEVRSGDECAATICLGTREGECFRESAVGATPCDAIYRTIDRCVDAFLELPVRRMVDFSVPPTVGGAEAEAKAMITVVCDRRYFETSASHINMMHAFAHAYVSAINQILISLDLG